MNSSDYLDIITDIRQEGYYVSDDYSTESREHTDITLYLLSQANNMIDGEYYELCDGVCFSNGHPYAELIDFEGELTYKELEF